MLGRRSAIVGLVLVGAIAMIAVSAPIASAHNGEDHGGGGATQPGTTGNATPVVTGGGGNAGDPAAGAQPAAPGAAQEVPQAGAGAQAVGAQAVGAQAVGAQAVANGAAGDDAAADADDDVIVEVPSVPAASSTTSRRPVESGGGGPAATNAPAVATPAGELPFTGLGETILLVVLAGVLLPLGVLAYSFARHGDARILRTHLAMPRFQWAPSGAAAPVAAPRVPTHDPSRFQWHREG